MEVISKEKALAALRQLVELPNEMRVQAMAAVSRVKAEDAVPVVYCKNCARCIKGFCTIRKDGWGATLKVGLHDFCSDGERRGG